MNAIEVDRTKVKPVVKITGEFWAQITEGDGNFNMFDFLEREGAQVIVEPIATWVAYLLYQAKAHAKAKWPSKRPHRNTEWYELKKNLPTRWSCTRSSGALASASRHVGVLLSPHHQKPGRPHSPAWFRRPNWPTGASFYNQFARGGEGHLEVGKNVYYTVHKLCHMVLALKPFGCMPSSQSDGVQSAVINKFKDMIFLPIETSGEGEVNAHSRVQMALGEAKVKAKAEFETALKSTGKRLDDIRELRRRASRAAEAVLSRAAPRGHRRHGGAIRSACQRSDEERYASVAAFARAGHRSAGGGKRRLITDKPRARFYASSRGSELPRCEGDGMHDHSGQTAKPTASDSPAPPQRPHDHHTQFMVGLDVGSTTVKAIVVDAASDKVVWQDYQRHETKQPEKTLEFLRRIEEEVGVNRHNTRMFITGSGGGTLAELVGAKFVQEVTAVSLAVEKMHPEVYSVIELGGQDAKIIVFKDDNESGRKKKIPSMNDKCAGGTGAVIDKINAKLKIPVDSSALQGYDGIKLHKVAGKCGVFAETDINSLQKDGTPPDELMASLFEAIVLQNLSVLTRGHTLSPHVLLLGGPNTFIRGMREAWQVNIPAHVERTQSRSSRGREAGGTDQSSAERAVFRRAGRGGIRQDRRRRRGPLSRRRQAGSLHRFRTQEEKAKSGGKGLVEIRRRAGSVQGAYRRKKFIPAVFQQRNQTVGGFVGMDGGSTSTKAVLLDENGDILCKAYQLSNGNPIQDTIDMFEKLRGQVESQSAKMEVLGVATTGYAKDILKDVLHADVALVETVAHTESAMKFYDDPHVIVDVGGQDIKLIVLKNGRVKDFKLNTQCSAGNGYFLQSTAEGFGLKVEEYRRPGLSRLQSMPVFGYGCAVFMQSDIVNFQRQGWRAEEILAGLAAVLPKNVFLYVASIPNLAALGSRFVLQGGTQNNMAVVKAEVDFIRSSFRAAGKKPEIIVHEHCGESGAIGAAVEAVRLWRNGLRTSFIGLDAVRNIEYRTTRNENTRCYFCKNNCLRTFIDINTDALLPLTKSIFIAIEECHQSAAPCRRAAPDHRHLRKGHGGRDERYERHQGWPGRDQGAIPQLRRHRRARSLPLAQDRRRGRSRFRRAPGPNPQKIASR